jgi:hypothetical protein
MATSSSQESNDPITPAGDVDAVLCGLADVDLDAATSTDTDDDATVLPELDAAFDELATLLDSPAERATHAAANAVDALDPDDDAASAKAANTLARERADFEEIAANTEVDAIPYENAAAFLANTLYAVPPANTRFQWVDPDALTPEWSVEDAF